MKIYNYIIKIHRFDNFPAFIIMTHHLRNGKIYGRDTTKESMKTENSKKIEYKKKY